MAGEDTLSSLVGQLAQRNRMREITPEAELESTINELPTPDEMTEMFAGGGPFGAGGLAGVLRPQGQAATALRDYIWKVWPSLGKKLDAAPDIGFRFADTNEVPGAGAFFRWPTAKTLPGGEITIQPDTAQAKNYATNLQNMLHEMLHAIYYHKGLPTSEPPMIDLHADRLINRSPMTQWRKDVYTRGGHTLQHAALDAMAANMMKNEIGMKHVDAIHPSFR